MVQPDPCRLRPQLFAALPPTALLVCLLSLLACGDGDHAGPTDDADAGLRAHGPGDGPGPDGPPGADGDGDGAPGDGDSGDGDSASGDGDTSPPRAMGWFADNTVAYRVDLPLARAGVNLSAQQLVEQLEGYDPGSLLRCDVADDMAYRAAIDMLGGTAWGYNVFALDDLSKPRFQAGLQRQLYLPAPNDAAGNAEAVEIEKPDIVAVTEAAALFYSRSHGLMLVDLTGAEPTFSCATPLPGLVDQFFFHAGHLVAMTRQHAGAHSFLLHFDVDATTITFVESVDLGAVRILDSRRFNDRLVFYTDLHIEGDPTVDPEGFAGGALYPSAFANHRSLRVYALGDRLTEELHDTLIDTTVSEDQLVNTGVTPTTPIGAVVNESRAFGSNMWASDHYFAVTQAITKTRLSGYRTQNYSICTAGHTVETTYTQCTTRYETRPNPNYRPPDNSSGDRSCKGVTLSDCLREVAGSANETIEVAVGQDCVEQPYSRWVCDQREQRMTQYPTFDYERTTQLYIYEYQPSGFVRLDASVREITNTGLSALALSDSVPVLTTSAQTFDLAVPGMVQTLYFQNGILYVISEGVLQVYTLSGSSLVRTASLSVVNDTLQASLFAGDKLFLSDFGYANGQDHSTLRVVDLQNPAFPRVEAATHSLPGGHRSIIASQHGIFTIGSVRRFEGQTINAIKLGLYANPYADEQAYLILATQFDNTYLLEQEAEYWSGAGQRLLLPYFGTDNALTDYRVSISRVAPGEIVSEGAVSLPEPVQRIRPVDSTQASFLAFADSSIAWLRPNGAEWRSTPVLDYFKPFAVLRLNDNDDYAEVQRLGDRCKVFLANANTINQRDSGRLSAEFACGRGSVQAYDHVLMFGQTGIEFDDKAGLRTVSAGEIMGLQQAISARKTCLLTLDLLDNVALDYSKDYKQSDFTCVSPEELARLTSEANQNP